MTARIATKAHVQGGRLSPTGCARNSPDSPSATTSTTAPSIRARPDLWRKDEARPTSTLPLSAGSPADLRPNPGNGRNSLSGGMTGALTPGPVSGRSRSACEQHGDHDARACERPSPGRTSLRPDGDRGHRGAATEWSRRPLPGRADPRPATGRQTVGCLHIAVALLLAGYLLVPANLP